MELCTILTAFILLYSSLGSHKSDFFGICLNCFKVRKWAHTVNATQRLLKRLQIFSSKALLTFLNQSSWAGRPAQKTNPKQNAGIPLYTCDISQTTFTARVQQSSCVWLETTGATLDPRFRGDTRPPPLLLNGNTLLRTEVVGTAIMWTPLPQHLLHLLGLESSETCRVPSSWGTPAAITAPPASGGLKAPWSVLFCDPVHAHHRRSCPRRPCLVAYV